MRTATRAQEMRPLVQQSARQIQMIAMASLGPFYGSSQDEFVGSPHETTGAQQLILECLACWRFIIDSGVGNHHFVLVTLLDWTLVGEFLVSRNSKKVTRQDTVVLRDC